LAQNYDKLKQESIRSVQHYKNKYNEYKLKMRKANQNIGTLTARIAKYDIEMGAEREDAPQHEAISGPHGGPNLWSGGGD
jgi:hypothetical protein